MQNPYEVLSINQDASDEEINRGFNAALMKNMKTKQFAQAELMVARKQLLLASSRLVADFMYPARPRAKRPKAFVWLDATEEISLASFLPDAHSSL